MTSIPSSLAPFFQEYSLEQLDVREAANTIIERTLRFGNRAEIRWLFDTYSRCEISEWVRRWGSYGLPEPHLTFWNMVLEIKSGCEYNQLIPQYKAIMNTTPLTLTGHNVRLEPLSESHIPDLCRVGLDERIWRFMRYGMVLSEAQMRTWVLSILEKQAKGNEIAFAVIHLESGRAVGATRYLNIQPDQRNLEIGGTWFGVDYQRTAVNTENKYMLLKHAFEEMGIIRVQIKTDLRNVASQRAIERLGAKKEGVLRKHMILPNGYIRDSVIYSIIDDDWKTVKAGLEEKMKGWKIENREK